MVAIRSDLLELPIKLSQQSLALAFSSDLPGKSGRRPKFHGRSRVIEFERSLSAYQQVFSAIDPKDGDLH